MIEDFDAKLRRKLNQDTSTAQNRIVTQNKRCRIAICNTFAHKGVTQEGTL